MGPQLAAEAAVGPDAKTEDDEHDLACEAGAIRARPLPIGPSREERQNHEAVGHVPYRAWRRACVAGRGRSDAHRPTKETEQAVPTIGLDYGYL